MREAPASPLGLRLARFLAGAEALGYSARPRAGMASQVAIRMLIQAGRGTRRADRRRLRRVREGDHRAGTRLGRALKHYRAALYATRAVIYHLGAPRLSRCPGAATLGRWSWERHLDGVSPQIRRPMTAYLERLRHPARSTVQGPRPSWRTSPGSSTGHDPGLASLALLDRQRHIEPYLAAVAARSTPAPASRSPPRPPRHGSRPSAASWTTSSSGAGPRPRPGGWSSPATFPGCPARCPATCPPTLNGRCWPALKTSPNRLRADALLLLRATGMRIGELIDLELDCVHEVPGPGAWLKVPLGKLDTERMVPIDEETLDIIDRIVARRSPGRPLPHPRTGKLADFLLTHQGRRVSVDSLREELHRAAAEAGPGRRGAPPAQAHLCHRPGQRGVLAAGADGAARARVRRR